MPDLPVRDIEAHVGSLPPDRGRALVLAPVTHSLPQPPCFMLGDAPARMLSQMFLQHVTGPVACYVLRDAMITGEGVVIHQDTALSCDVLNLPAIHLELAVLPRLSGASLPVRHVARQAVMLCGPGYSIYGHWIVDMLPRLYVLHRLGLDLDRLTYALPRDVPDFVLDLLRLVGIAEAQLLRYDQWDEVLAVPELLVPTNLRRHDRGSPLFAEAMAFLKARMAATSELTRLPRGPDRLFVSREIPGGRRTLENRAAIEALAVEAGFTVVHPERMPLVEQVALFHGARRIAGEYGSGLHNCLFSPPGTMVCAARSTSVHPGFVQSGLAEGMGQQVGYVFGPAPDHATDQAFTVAEDLFRGALACMDLPQAGAVPRGTDLV